MESYYPKGIYFGIVCYSPIDNEVYVGGLYF